MDEADLLKRQLRAAREELVRRGAANGEEMLGETSRFPLMPDREEEFLRLALMSVDELESHVERLERDLRDLQEGIDDLDSDDRDRTD